MKDGENETKITAHLAVQISLYVEQGINGCCYIWNIKVSDWHFRVGILKERQAEQTEPSDQYRVYYNSSSPYPQQVCCSRCLKMCVAPSPV